MISGLEKVMYIDEEALNTSNENQNECSTADVVEACTSGTENKENKTEWGESDTKLLLDLYHEGLPQVGPLKKFRNKRAMWNHISKQIETRLNVSRTPSQCESRYKTVLKRKVTATKINKTSGETRKDVDFEDEIEKIKSLDDSVEPEVLMSGDTLKIKKRAVSPSTSLKDCNKIPQKKKKSELFTLLTNMHKEKEENKERRHREKLDLLKELFQQ